MGSDPPLPESADIVIVGGGVIGTSIAYFLGAETNLDVILIEKDNIASGSTGDSSAILRHHYGPDEIYTKMAWWSHEFYRRFTDETGEHLAHADSPLVRVGSDREEDSYTLAGYETMQSHGIPSTKYTPESFSEAFPMLSFEGVEFAVSDDAAGYSDGTDAAGGFSRAAQANGITVRTQTPVTGFSTSDGSVDGVETGKGTIRCENVVLAAGPWTGRLAERLDIQLPITVEREQVVILDPPEAFTEQYPDLVPMTALPGGELYLRSDFGEGILVATHHSGDVVNPDTYSNQPDERRLLDLVEQLSQNIPGLENAGIRGQYCGVYSTTPDHDFIIDKKQGCYLACGFSGHGFKHAPAVGRIVADLIIDNGTDFVDLERFSLDRFVDNPEGNSLADGQI